MSLNMRLRRVRMRLKVILAAGVLWNRTEQGKDKGEDEKWLRIKIRKRVRMR